MKFLIALMTLSTLLLVGCRHKSTPPQENENPTPQDAIDPNTQNEVVNLVTVTTPQANSTINSPLYISGTAPGYWFFEATAPIVITNRDGLIIAEGYISATEDWMTEELVPFEGTILYTVDPNRPSNAGTLILRKSNPSGLPENDVAIEIPIILG